MSEKKTTIITIIVVVVLLALLIVAALVGGKSSSKNEEPTERTAETVVANAEKESAAVKENEKKEFTYINVDTYLEYLNSSENTFILVARPTCHYCQIAEPILQNIMYEYNIDLNYLNTDDFEGEDQNNFVNSYEGFKNGFGTPMLFVVKDGDVLDGIDGLMDRYGYIEFFKTYGLIE